MSLLNVDVSLELGCCVHSSAYFDRIFSQTLSSISSCFELLAKLSRTAVFSFWSESKAVGNGWYPAISAHQCLKSSSASISRSNPPFRHWCAEIAGYQPF